MTFPENKIRQACRKAKISPAAEERLISELMRFPGGEVFADDDTITVKELREAGKRLHIPGFPSTFTRLEEALEDILAHREPEYIPGKIYVAPDGGYWYRSISFPGKWTTPGSAAVRAHETPRRPLRGPLG